MSVMPLNGEKRAPIVFGDSTTRARFERTTTTGLWSSPLDLN